MGTASSGGSGGMSLLSRPFSITHPEERSLSNRKSQRGVYGWKVPEAVQVAKGNGQIAEVLRDTAREVER